MRIHFSRGYGKGLTMRKLMIAMLAAALGVLTGCGAMLSRNPLFPENAKEVAFDPALLGKWQDVTGQDKSIYEVSRLDDASYLISFEDHGRHETATAQLLKAHALLLLDIRFADEDGAGASKSYFTRHLFAKIRTEPDTVHVAPIGSKWLKERILATGKPAYKQEGEKKEDIVLTAPSAELRKTLLPYFDRPEAFETEEQLRRVK
jgi:hypothetical protein